MRRDLGAPGLPPKPERPKLDDLLAQARRGLETQARLEWDNVQRWMDPKASSELSKGAVRTVQSLCVRLHSLGYCTLQLGVLSQLVDARWAGVQARRTFYGREARPAPVTVLSNGAPEAVAATIDLMCEFIGAKVSPHPRYHHHHHHHLLLLLLLQKKGKRRLCRKAWRTHTQCSGWQLIPPRVKSGRPSASSLGLTTPTKIGKRACSAQRT